MFADMRTAIPMAAALTTYFYFRPTVPEYVTVPFLVVWITCFCLDAKITISNSRFLEHERNLVFPTLYRKLGGKSVLIQFLIEAVFIVAIAVIFENVVNALSLSVVSLVFGIAHLEAYFANMSIVKRLGQSNL
jgi:hypothetical protein